MSDGRLDAKVIFITGCTGIAAATVLAAAAEGAQVFFAGLSAEDCARLEDQVRAAGGVCGWSAGDLAEASVVSDAVSRCSELFGTVDGLFNVAGISGRRFGDGPVHECTEEGWDKTMSANGKTAFLVSRAVLRQMLGRAASGGSILHMASVLAAHPEPRHFATHAYSASKGALVSLTLAMAAFYAPYGIRVNCLAPGLVRTPMSARAQEDPDVLAYIRAKQPLGGGMLAPEEIARIAVFLLSDEARMITGQVLTVDGGWSVTGV